MVFDFLKRAERGDGPAVVEKKASATGRVVAWGSSGRVAWTPRDAVSLAQERVSGQPDRVSRGQADRRGGGGPAGDLSGRRAAL